MKKVIGACWLVLGLWPACTCAQEADYIPIDPPGSNFTIAMGINNRGQSAGYYLTSAARYGFIRESCGSLTTFTFPGFGLVNAINAKGELVGSYSDVNANFVSKVFFRDVNGMITPFSMPGAKGGTGVAGLNDSGEIVGNYSLGSPDSANHIFLREPDGSFITIDVPGATIQDASGINNRGDIIGGYYTAPTQSWAFVRYHDGRIVTFNGPDGGNGTTATSINDSDEITGYYNDTHGGIHGFIRYPDGVMVTFDGPGSKYTLPSAINERGDVVGFYHTPTGPNHGFVRTSDGTFTSFDPPDSGNTSASGINDRGEIVGNYFLTGDLFDQNALGFLRVPREQCGNP